jgi:hypothetical protein
MSKIEVDAIEPQSGTTLTIGASGDTITIPSGATLSSTDPLVFPAGTVSLPSITTTGDTNTGIFFPSADTIAFTEGGAEAMRIDSSGQVGIGTSTPSAVLQVNESTTGTANFIFSNLNQTSGISTQQISLDLTFDRSGGGFGAGGLAGGKIIAGKEQEWVGAAANQDGFLSFHTCLNEVVAEKMKITSGGSLILIGSTAQKASGTTWSNPSDTRLKDNKQNYTKGLTELLQINVKTWEWNGKAGTTQGTTGIGVIADEIEVLLPNTVDTYKAKLNINDTEETDVKRFDATEITWLLLNSIKEQQVIIEQLKATTTSQQTKIDALEARLTALESNIS